MLLLTDLQAAFGQARDRRMLGRRVPPSAPPVEEYAAGPSAPPGAPQRDIRQLLRRVSAEELAAMGAAPEENDATDLMNVTNQDRDQADLIDIVI